MSGKWALAGTAIGLSATPESGRSPAAVREHVRYMAASVDQRATLDDQFGCIELVLPGLDSYGIVPSPLAAAD